MDENLGENRVDFVEKFKIINQDLANNFSQEETCVQNVASLDQKR